MRTMLSLPLLLLPILKVPIAFVSRMQPQGGAGEEESKGSGAVVGATSHALSHGAPHHRGQRSRGQELAVAGHRERFARLDANVDP